MCLIKTANSQCCCRRHWGETAKPRCSHCLVCCYLAALFSLSLPCLLLSSPSRCLVCCSLHPLVASFAPFPSCSLCCCPLHPLVASFAPSPSVPSSFVSCNCEPNNRLRAAAGVNNAHIDRKQAQHQETERRTVQILRFIQLIDVVE